MNLHVPAALAAERNAFRAEIERAISAGGMTGAAAKEVARLLDDHFAREEDYALPPLSLLRRLAKGERDPAMERAGELAERLEAEMPALLAEHSTIVQALNRLADAADSDGQPEIVRLCDKLIAHVRLEEDVLYPAALLVGRHLRMSSASQAA